MRGGSCRHDPGLPWVRGADVGQPPVMADTGGQGGRRGERRRGGGGTYRGGRQALPEPYVPGSGDRLSAELRLVLAGYVGIAAGFHCRLGRAAAAVHVFSATSSSL